MLYRFALDEIAPTPWKNGGGATREIACWPIGAGLDAFDWRVSVASIAADGPFSVFVGIDRHIMLLDGAGVHLRSVDGAVDHRLDVRFEPFTFDGAASVTSTLLGGPSTDFNVMSRRAAGSTTLVIIDAQQALASTDQGLLMCLTGTWQCGTELLRSGQGFWWADPSELGGNIEPLSPGALLALVQWNPAA